MAQLSMRVALFVFAAISAMLVAADVVRLVRR